MHNPPSVHLFRLLAYNYSIQTSERGFNYIQITHIWHTHISPSWQRKKIRFNSKQQETANHQLVQTLEAIDLSNQGGTKQKQWDADQQSSRRSSVRACCVAAGKGADIKRYSDRSDELLPEWAFLSFFLGVSQPKHWTKQVKWLDRTSCLRRTGRGKRSFFLSFLDFETPD